MENSYERHLVRDEGVPQEAINADRDAMMAKFFEKVGPKIEETREAIVETAIAMACEEKGVDPATYSEIQKNSEEYIATAERSISLSPRERQRQYTQIMNAQYGRPDEYN